MWDLGMYPSLTEIAVSDPVMFHLLTLMFGGIVGIAVALVVFEVLWFHWYRHTNSEVENVLHKHKEKVVAKPSSSHRDG